MKENGKQMNEVRMMQKDKVNILQPKGITRYGRNNSTKNNISINNVRIHIFKNNKKETIKMEKGMQLNAERTSKKKFINQEEAKEQGLTKIRYIR